MTNAILKVDPVLLEWHARFATKTETRSFYDTGTLHASVTNSRFKLYI